jgi:hypothetical protein
MLSNEVQQQKGGGGSGRKNSNSGCALQPKKYNCAITSERVSSAVRRRPRAKLCRAPF